MRNRVGATQWTIGKLMTIVLLMIVLALVVYGVSTKGLNPLIERAGGMFDEVQLLFGFGDSSNAEKNCVSYSEYLDGVGEGIVTSCKGSCAVDLEEGLEVEKIFNWTQGFLFVKKGSQWDRIWDAIDSLPLAIKEREMNKILKEDYEDCIGHSEGSSIMGSEVIPIYILVKQRFRQKYFRWEDGVWSEEKGNEWKKKKEGEEIEGLKKIYLSSKGWFGGEVFFKIGNSEGDEEDFYKVFDIFGKRAGRINDDNDFNIFQDWFSSEKEKITETQKVLEEGMRRAEELLPSESLGEFEEEPYYLFLIRDSDGEGVFYLETSEEKYGLKGEGLRLVKDRGEAGWKIAESSPTLGGTDEEFEERIKIHRIRKFLERIC